MSSSLSGKIKMLYFSVFFSRIGSEPMSVYFRESKVKSLGSFQKHIRRNIKQKLRKNGNF